MLMVHEPLHTKVPLLKFELYPLQLKSLKLNLVPSHVSPVSSLLLPHGGALEQLPVSSLHELQFKVPPLKSAL